MEELRLVPVTAADAKIIAEYCAAFPESRMRVTFEENRIPGLDHLEEYGNIAAIYITDALGHYMVQDDPLFRRQNGRGGDSAA